VENENLNEGLEQVGKLIVNKLKVLADEQGFKDSGDLIRSFRYETTANNLAIFSAKYARALSDGIKNKGKYNKEMSNNLASWARSKGMRPLFRDSKGRFRKVSESSFKSLGFVLARSIAGKSNAREPKNKKGGISKRFGYKGSGFFQTMEDQLKEQIRTILSESYKKDLKLQIKRDGINTN